MTPHQQHQHTNHSDWSASAWTETDPSETSHPAEFAAQPTMPERPCDNETQAPTHDALSSIYNRGY